MSGGAVRQGGCGREGLGEGGREDKRGGQYKRGASGKEVHRELIVLLFIQLLQTLHGFEIGSINKSKQLCWVLSCADRKTEGFTMFNKNQHFLVS